MKKILFLLLALLLMPVAATQAATATIYDAGPSEPILSGTPWQTSDLSLNQANGTLKATFTIPGDPASRLTLSGSVNKSEKTFHGSLIGKRAVQSSTLNFSGEGTFAFDGVRFKGPAKFSAALTGRDPRDYSVDEVILNVTSAELTNYLNPASTIKVEDSLSGSVTSVEGDVEISKDGGKSWVTLTSGTKIEKGDEVSTGYESLAVIKFGHGELRVTSMSQIAVDELVNKDNLERTQLNLRVGSVRAIINVPASIRADFSVQAGPTSASIRGSEMVVSYDEKSGATVYVIDDQAFVSVSGAPEQVIPVGKKVVVSAAGVMGTPIDFSPAELETVRATETSNPETSKNSSLILWAIIAIALLGIIYYFNIGRNG